MLNIDDFIKRLEKMLDYYNLSASVFADKLGVQRSGLSHLLSGRNKPSLDLIMKITENFPEADLYWLLNGKGNFPKNEDAHDSPIQQIVHKPHPVLKESTKDTAAPDDLFSDFNTAVQSNRDRESDGSFEGGENSVTDANNDDIDRIVVFYKSGIFKSYKPG